MQDHLNVLNIPGWGKQHKNKKYTKISKPEEQFYYTSLVSKIVAIFLPLLDSEVKHLKTESKLLF